MQPCILGCGLGLLGSDMDYHTKRQCLNAETKCPVCEEMYKHLQLKKDGKEHDCVQHLKQALSEARQMIEAMKLSNQRHVRGPEQ